MAAYSTIVYQDMGIKPNKMREYLLLVFWQIGVLFLVFCYAAVLLSFLTFPSLSGVRTIPELAAAVAKGKYQCTCYPGSFLLGILSKSSDPKDRIIGRNLMKNKGSKDIESTLSNFKSKKKPVFIGGEDELLPLKFKYFVSEDEFIPAMRAVAMPKGFCCKTELNKVIGYVWASGIFQKLKEDGMFMESLTAIEKSFNYLYKSKRRALSMADLLGAFILLAVGFMFAAAALILEMVIRKPRASYKMRSSMRHKKSLFFIKLRVLGYDNFLIHKTRWKKVKNVSVLM